MNTAKQTSRLFEKNRDAHAAFDRLAAQGVVVPWRRTVKPMTKNDRRRAYAQARSRAAAASARGTAPVRPSARGRLARARAFLLNAISDGVRVVKRLGRRPGGAR